MRARRQPPSSALASSVRPSGSTVSTLACGRAMMWVATTSPTFAALRDARLDRGLHRRDVAAHDGGHVAAAGLLVADELDLGGLHHRVGRLDHRGEPAGLDHSQCVCHCLRPSPLRGACRRGGGAMPSRRGPSRPSIAATAARQPTSMSRLLAAEVHAAHRAERADLEDVDRGGLLGLVGGQRRVGRGLHLEHVQRLPAEDHVPVPGPVDQLGLVVVDVADDLARQDPRLDPRGLLDADLREDRRAGGPDLRLRRRVDLEQAEEPLDDLHRRA